MLKGGPICWGRGGTGPPYTKQGATLQDFKAVQLKSGKSITSPGVSSISSAPELHDEAQEARLTMLQVVLPDSGQVLTRDAVSQTQGDQCGSSTYKHENRPILVRPSKTRHWGWESTLVRVVLAPKHMVLWSD